VTGRREPSAFDLLEELAPVLDGVGLVWMVGGSVASSILGEPRATVDLDLAVYLDLDGLDRLIEAVDTRFYVPSTSARAAVEGYGSFNIIDPSTGLKVDLFVLGPSFLDRCQAERRRRLTLAGIGEVWVTDPTAQILRKLHWYRVGGETSGHQWRDVVGLVRSEGSELPREQLRADAQVVGVQDLLEEAFAEADQIG